MPWNEPGGNKDPWSGNRGEQGPPDLDELLKKLTGGFGRILGGRGGSSGRGRISGQCHRQRQEPGNRSLTT